MVSVHATPSCSGCGWNDRACRGGRWAGCPRRSRRPVPTGDKDGRDLVGVSERSSTPSRLAVTSSVSSFVEIAVSGGAPVNWGSGRSWIVCGPGGRLLPGPDWSRTCGKYLPHPAPWASSRRVEPSRRAEISSTDPIESTFATVGYGSASPRDPARGPPGSRGHSNSSSRHSTAGVPSVRPPRRAGQSRREV